MNTGRVRRRSGRTGGLTAVLAALVLVLAGCTGDPDDARSGPRPLTTGQAELLAGIRYANHQAGLRGIELTIPGDGDVPALTIVGWYDFAGHLGYGKVTRYDDASAPRTGMGGAADGTVLGLVCWTPATIGVVETSRDELPLPIPAAAAPLTALDPGASTLNELLALVADLGADRPEDAVALAGSDARWVRADLLGGVPVDVFAGATSDAFGRVDRSGGAAGTAAGSGRPLLYWVDSSGRLLRVQTAVDPSGTGTGTPVLADIDFARAGDVRLTEPEPEPAGTGGPATSGPQPPSPAPVPPTWMSTVPDPVVTGPGTDDGSGPG